MLDERRRVKSLGVLGGLAIIVAMYLVLVVPPTSFWIQATLVVDLGIAVTLLVAVVAYRLSFRIFHSRREQGRVGRAVFHGGVAGSLVIVALSLQLLRVLNPLALALLGMCFVTGQVYVFLRRA